MVSARKDSTIAALKAKIEKTRRIIEQRKSSLEPLEKEHDDARIRATKAMESRTKILKNHTARIRAMENKKKKHQQQLRKMRKTAEATPQNGQFHARLEEKREETRERREEYLKLKAETQVGLVQANRDASRCGICLERYDDDEKLPKVLGCGHTTCLECLDSLEKRNDHTMSCPFCREVVSSRNCPTNLFIMNK